MARATMTLGAPLLGLWMLLRPDPAMLARRLTLDDLPRREDILSWTPETAALDRAILSARDDRLVETLAREADGAAPGAHIAVVYGAGHMPAVLRALPRLGFAWAASDWITVFRT